MFPAKIYRAPRSWGEQSCGNLNYWNEVDKGDHAYVIWLSKSRIVAAPHDEVKQYLLRFYKGAALDGSPFASQTNAPSRC